MGVGIIFANQVSLDDPSAAWGCLAIVVAACVTAYSGLLIKTQARHIDPIALTMGQMLVGMVPLLLVGAIFEGNPLSFTWGMNSWLAILYLAFVGSSVTFILLYWLIKRIDLTKVQLIPISSTLVAVFWVAGSWERIWGYGLWWEVAASCRVVDHDFEAKGGEELGYARVMSVLGKSSPTHSKGCPAS